MIKLNKKQRRALRNLAKMPRAKNRKQHARQISVRMDRNG